MNDVKHQDHDRLMRRCFDLARRGLGHTRSNPIVGAVLVHDGRIIGEGWHRVWGGQHAEVECIEGVPPDDKPHIPDSMLYVSLEPCAHWGKQPPCAGRILQEGIRRVVVSVDDPNPQVGGRGYEILEAAGVEVTRGVLRGEGRWLTRRFLSLHEQRRPYIILKWAQSADGFIAPPHGRRVMISGAVSQRLVHQWRVEEEAILVGYRTALLDNPRLTARFWQGPQPLRIVLDRDSSLPRTHHLFHDGAPMLMVSASSAVALATATPVLQTPFDEKLIPRLLQHLKASNISSLIVEGGAATLTTFIQAGLWDEARIIHTPVVLGNGLPAPVLRSAQSAFHSCIDSGDFLAVYIRTDSPYPYSAGAVL